MNHRGIHWMSYDKLCVHKLAGGMGFRKFHEFHLAMLGKQGWRSLQEPSSLVAQIFKARYYHSSSFLEANIGPNPSYVWRSVLASQELIRKGVRRRIGSGERLTYGLNLGYQTCQTLWLKLQRLSIWSKPRSAL